MVADQLWQGFDAYSAWLAPDFMQVGCWERVSGLLTTILPQKDDLHSRDVSICAITHDNHLNVPSPHSGQTWEPCFSSADSHVHRSTKRKATEGRRDSLTALTAVLRWGGWFCYLRSEPEMAAKVSAAPQSNTFAVGLRRTKNLLPP